MAVNLTKPQRLMNAGKFAEAEAALPVVGASTDRRSEIIRARIQSARGDQPAALETLSALTLENPDFAPGHLFKGITLWDMADYPGAMAAFERVLELQKQNDLARSYRALCLAATGDRPGAAAVWNEFGFSDNAMFRVRTAEFVELSWLWDQSFMGGAQALDGHADTVPSTRKALRLFYKRDFKGMVRYLPGPGAKNELDAFLAATAHEMLRNYDEALAHLEHLESRRAEWPDPLIALKARLLVRKGEIGPAAGDFASIVVMGPEDFGINYYMAVVFLAYERRQEARQHFLRAFTDYMVDTLEFQWWQIEQTLLHPEGSATTAAEGRDRI